VDSSGFSSGDLDQAAPCAVCSTSQHRSGSAGPHHGEIRNTGNSRDASRPLKGISVVFSIRVSFPFYEMEPEGSKIRSHPGVGWREA
jgi:hypothetical protein